MNLNVQIRARILLIISLGKEACVGYNIVSMGKDLENWPFTAPRRGVGEVFEALKSRIDRHLFIFF